jgi:hypothetical protein
VPIAYGVFALALVLAAGVLLRRTIAAIGIAFAGFFVARYAITQWLRPEYFPPIRYSWRIGAPYQRITGPHDWLLAEGISDRHGTFYPSGPSDVVLQTCPPKFANAVGGQVMTPCLQHHGWIYNTWMYRPASQFWPFQIIESAIYLGMAALLGVATWWIRTKLV